MEKLNIMNTRTCPKCKSDWNGESIVETFKAQRDSGSKHWKNKSDTEIEEYVKKSYSPPYRWGREIGIELPYDDPKHYDGISIIRCPDCDTEFDRFTSEEIINNGKV